MGSYPTEKVEPEFKARDVHVPNVLLDQDEMTRGRYRS